MCGRYTITSSQQYLEERFKARFAQHYELNFNASPSQSLPVITSDKPDQIQLFNWGLLPDWWQQRNNSKQGIINIRQETLAEKFSFNFELKNQRCLVLADSFYEWQKNSTKTPWRILLKNEEPFAFAGLWQNNTLPDGRKLKTFSIITTTPNKLVKMIHNRMPVILSSKNESQWLTNSNDKKEQLKILKRYPSRLLTTYQLSKLVNNPRNNTPEVIAPAKI